jgi:RNA polymerase sigma-70 factor (ECF subfamily)
MDYRSLSSPALIQQCAMGKAAEAWREFIRRFQPLIAGVVARAAARWTTVSATLVDDLIQETYLKLCTDEFRRLREFQSRHEDAVYGFLKVVAYNVTMDYFKVRQASKRGADLLTDADPDVAFQTKGQSGSADDQVLLREIDEMIDRIAASRRDKTVFLLYYRQGFTAQAIAGVPGIDLTAKGVESCLHRLTVQLREHMAGTRR